MSILEEELNIQSTSTDEYLGQIKFSTAILAVNTSLLAHI